MSVPWRVYSSHKFPLVAHVNVQELEEMCGRVVDATVTTPGPELLVNLADSRVAMGVWAQTCGQRVATQR